jgi:signal transduction histidine kinase
MLSDIAHDLRTPITTISGYAMALSDGMVEEDKKQEYLDAIQVKSKRMSDLINLLFDYVRLDSENFNLNKEKLDICEIVREAGAFQFQDIEDAGMTLDVDIPEESIYREVDKLQFSRVITNLITNAIKHNSYGTNIGLYIISDDESPVKIMVADSGKVIPEEAANEIFDPFVMGDESRNSKGGSGLGLSISKKIVEMHGFKIKLIQTPKIERYKFLDGYNKVFIITI